jgi:hypothetical protein
MDMTQSKGIKWKDQKCKQMSGLESLGGATSGARGHDSHEGEIIMLEETEPGRSQSYPRPVGPGRLASPINGTPGARLLQASNSLLPLFVCSSF